jgi:GYF domain 2
MTTLWYYLANDAATDGDLPVGPLSLESLIELIRAGSIAEDTLVRVGDSGWEYADRVEPVVTALPLDRERLIEEYIGYGEAEIGHENWGWASHRMNSLLVALPELAWPITTELIDRAPSDQSLGFFAASPLEDLLSAHGEQFIDRVEDRAATNPKFKRALGILNQLGMTEHVWHRVLAAGAP